jgi:hypothetical protein
MLEGQAVSLTEFVLEFIFSIKLVLKSPLMKIGNFSTFVNGIVVFIPQQQFIKSPFHPCYGL